MDGESLTDAPYALDLADHSGEPPEAVPTCPHGELSPQCKDCQIEELRRQLATARREALEECVRIAEGNYEPVGSPWPVSSPGIAAAIRALIPQRGDAAGE